MKPWAENFPIRMNALSANGAPMVKKMTAKPKDQEASISANPESAAAKDEKKVMGTLHRKNWRQQTPSVEWKSPTMRRWNSSDPTWRWRRRIKSIATLQLPKTMLSRKKQRKQQLTEAEFHSAVVSGQKQGGHPDNAYRDPGRNDMARLSKSGSQTQVGRQTDQHKESRLFMQDLWLRNVVLHVRQSPAETIPSWHPWWLPRWGGQQESQKTIAKLQSTEAVEIWNKLWRYEQSAYLMHLGKIWSELVLLDDQCKEVVAKGNKFINNSSGRQ